jgi:hypothetical protein
LHYFFRLDVQACWFFCDHEADRDAHADAAAAAAAAAASVDHYDDSAVLDDA